MSTRQHVVVESTHRISSQSRSRPKPPPLYKVLLHNDNQTTQEFVVLLLQTVFHKPKEEATHIMLQVHNAGIGVAGLYPYELAENKVAKTIALALQHEYPLHCTMEQA